MTKPTRQRGPQISNLREMAASITDQDGSLNPEQKTVFYVVVGGRKGYYCAICANTPQLRAVGRSFRGRGGNSRVLACPQCRTRVRPNVYLSGPAENEPNKTCLPGALTVRPQARRRKKGRS